MRDPFRVGSFDWSLIIVRYLIEPIKGAGRLMTLEVWMSFFFALLFLFTGTDFCLHLDPFVK